MHQDVDELIGRLRAAVDDLVDLPVAALDEPTIRRLTRVQTEAASRLTAHRSSLAAALATRRAEAARVEHPGDVRARERARRDVQRQLADDCRLTASQAKQDLLAGRAVAGLPVARAPFADGRLSGSHVKVLLDLLNAAPPHLRHELEAELVPFGEREDAVAFGRRCRRRLSEVDHEAAMARLDRQYSQRKASITTTPEGTTRLFAEGPGLDAELLHTAIDAFRRPDAANETRSSEQRTWDALIDLAAAALRAVDGPTRHGVRPHISVVVRDAELAAARGSGDGEHTGPLPYGELRRIFGDTVLSMTLAGANWLPLAVSGEVRTVPVGLWRALVARDRGCLWAGCDMPARWCDVAHLTTAYKDGGRLAPDTAGLLCRRHHRRYDRGGHSTRFVDGFPLLVRNRDGATVGGLASVGASGSRGDPPGRTAPPPDGATHRPQPTDRRPVQRALALAPG